MNYSEKFFSGYGNDCATMYKTRKWHLQKRREISSIIGHNKKYDRSNSTMGNTSINEDNKIATAVLLDNVDGQHDSITKSQAPLFAFC